MGRHHEGVNEELDLTGPDEVWFGLQFGEAMIAGSRQAPLPFLDLGEFPLGVAITIAGHFAKAGSGRRKFGSLKVEAAIYELQACRQIVEAALAMGLRDALAHVLADELGSISDHVAS